MLQREPRQARSLADAAIRDDRLIAHDALRGVQRPQLLHALERAIIVAVLAPRDAPGARDVAAALTRFRQSGRRQNFAREFLRAANVDECRRFRFHRLLHFRQERAQRRVGRLRLVRLRGDRRLLGAEVAAFGEPFLSAAVHDPHVLVPVHLQLPERPGGKPVVVVAVQDDRRLVVDAGAAEKGFELVRRHDVAHNGVAELGRPVPACCAGHVSLIVRRRIHIDLDDPDAGVGRMLCDPIRGREDTR